MSDNKPVSFRLTTREFPSRGSLAIQKVFNHTAGVMSIEGDLYSEMENGLFDFLQSVKIDNSQNAFPYSITFAGLGAVGDTIICPPYSLMTSQVLQVAESKPKYFSATAGGVLVPVTFLNVELPYMIYSVAAAVSPIPTGVATNKSIAALTGATQVIVPANASRKRVVIQNPANNANSIWINYALPATGDYLSQEILPGQQFDTAGGAIALSAINVIGTNGQPVFAYEIA